MQNTAFPTSVYNGCTIRGLPITAPFRIQYETEGRENKIGCFIILPFQLIPGSQIYDFTFKQCSTPVHISPTNPQVAQRENYIEIQNASDNLDQDENDRTKNSVVLQPLQNMSCINDEPIEDYCLPCAVETVENNHLNEEQDQTEKEVESGRNDSNEVPEIIDESVKVDSEIRIKLEPDVSGNNWLEKSENVSTKETDIKKGAPGDDSLPEVVTGLQSILNTNSDIPTTHIQNMSDINDEPVGDYYLQCEYEVVENNYLNEEQDQTETEADSGNNDSNKVPQVMTESMEIVSIEIDSDIRIKTEPGLSGKNGLEKTKISITDETDFKKNEPSDDTLPDVITVLSTDSDIQTNHIQNMSDINDEPVGDYYLQCEYEVVENNHLNEIQDLTEKEAEIGETELNKVPEVGTKSLEIDLEMEVKTEPVESMCNSNTEEMDFEKSEACDNSLPFKADRGMIQETDTSGIETVNRSNEHKTLNSDTANAALVETAMEDERKERQLVRLMSLTDHSYFKKATGKQSRKKSRWKNKIETNIIKAEEVENSSLVKKKKRPDTEKIAQITEMLELKRVKIQEDDNKEAECSRRKSSRLRSAGSRPDYQDVENKFDEFIDNLEEFDVPSDTKEDESHGDVNGENNRKEDTERSSTIRNGKNLKNKSLSKKKKDRDPDFDPTEFVTEEQSKNENGDESEIAVDTIQESSESEDECSDFDSDDSGSEIRKKISKKKHDSQWIHIKLEEHQDKYKTELLKSIARKDRGKSEIERSAEVYVCTLCNAFKSSGKEAIESHLEQHLNGKLDCKKCDFSASNARGLYLHKTKEHTSKKDRICPHCGIGFRAESLKNHMGAVHKDPQYECINCLKSKGEITKFFTRRQLRKHAEEMHRDIGFTCKYCEKVYLNKKCFKLHKMSCESDGHFCKTCGAKFNLASSLRNHINNVHLQIKTFQCTECPYAGTSRYSLSQHLLVHRGEHPYSCSECDFTCVQRCQLKSHMRTHTGEKPYKCTQCKYAAAWNVQLKEHILVHNMETAVMCQNCDILFKNEKTLNMHLKKEQCMM